MIFIDSDGDDSEEDDFVEFDDLPPLPEKSLSKPNLEDFPKQRINKTRSEAHRIGKIQKKKQQVYSAKDTKIISWF